MIVRIYDARQLIFKDEHPPQGKRELIVETRISSMHVEKLVIDGEETTIGEKDMLLLDVSRILFVEKTHDDVRDIDVYKEAHLTTKENSIKEVLRDVFEDAVIRIAHVE
jgi:hypothetical protein